MATPPVTLKTAWMTQADGSANSFVSVIGPPGPMGPSTEAAAQFAAQAGASALAAAGSATAAAASEAGVAADAATASSAAAVAEALVGPTYASTAAGLAATTSGQSFAVNNSGIVTIYLNAGGTAVAQRDAVTAQALADNTGAALIGSADGVTVQAKLDEFDNAIGGAAFSNTYASTTAALSNGVISTTGIVGGSGGTNGTFDLAFSGGAGTGAAGRFTVAGGALTSITITNPGTGYTSAPTLSFVASSGLTGASATAVIGARQPVGSYFYVPGTTPDALIQYRVDAGPVATEVARIASSSALVRVPPFAATATAANSTGGDATNFNRLLNGVVDVRIFGGTAAETYRIERVRRNASGWGARITRASDNATVAESYYTTGFSEPADPTVPQELYLAPNAVSTLYAIIKIRWSEFASGVFTSGWTAALAGTCLDRGAPGPANALTASAVRPGQMVMSLNSGEFCTVDETARTFSWPQLLIPDGRANSSGRYRIAAGSVTFSNNYEVAFIDLDEVLAAGVGEAPNTVVKKAVFGRDLVSNTNYAARPNQLPLAWSSHAGRVEVNPTIRLGSTQGTIYEDDTVVRVDPSSNLIQVYQRANGTSANQRTYIRTELYRDVAADRDNWTVRGVFECSRTSYETFTGGQRLQVNGTEILLAIREDGASDFMGGNAHGDEVITRTPTLLLDGLEVPLIGSAAWYHGKTLIFAQDSRYYRVGSSLGVALGERTLLLTFENGTVEADTRFQHLTNWTVADCYIAMLAPHRYVTYVDGTSENTGSAQISGKYLDDVRGIPYDISARQAASSPDDTVRVSQPVRRVMMWGTYGVSCEMEVLEANEPILTDLFYINRQSYAYNKAYIGFVGATSGNQAVTSSTVWTWKTRWRWRSKN